MIFVALTYEQDADLTRLIGLRLKSLGKMMEGVSDPTVTSIEEVTVDGRRKYLVRFTYSFPDNTRLFRGHEFVDFNTDDPKCLTNFIAIEGVRHG